MARVRGILLGVALLGIAAPLAAQSQPWVDQWFWGLQGAAYRFRTPEGSASWETGYTIGANWLITGRGMGLYLGFDHIVYNHARSQVADPTSATGVRFVDFHTGNYLTADLIAMPLKGKYQVMLGAGVKVHNIRDATAVGPFATPADQEYSQGLADDAASKALFNIMGGLQVLVSRRLAAYVTYEFIPEARNFLLSDEQHLLSGGLRYSFGSRKEEVSTIP